MAQRGSSDLEIMCFLDFVQGLGGARAFDFGQRSDGSQTLGLDVASTNLGYGTGCALRMRWRSAAAVTWRLCAFWTSFRASAARGLSISASVATAAKRSDSM